MEPDTVTESVLNEKEILNVRKVIEIAKIVYAEVAVDNFEQVFATAIENSLLQPGNIYHPS